MVESKEDVRRLKRWERLVQELQHGGYEWMTLDDYYNAVAHRSGLEKSDKSNFSDEFIKRIASADETFRQLTWPAPHSRLPGEYWFELCVPIHPTGDLALDLRDEFGYEAT